MSEPWEENLIEIEALKEQNAELLEALERIARIADSRIGVQPYTYRDIARAAIRQAKDGAK